MSADFTCSTRCPISLITRMDVFYKKNTFLFWRVIAHSENQLIILILNIIENFQLNPVSFSLRGKQVTLRSGAIRNFAYSPRFIHVFEIPHHLSTSFVVAFVYYLLMFPQLQSLFQFNVLDCDNRLASRETTQCLEQFVIVFAEI